MKASMHNGKFGIVTKVSTAGEGRHVGIKLPDGTVLAIKIENLELSAMMINNNNSDRPDPYKKFLVAR